MFIQLDDESEEEVVLDENGQMKCRVCSIAFKSKDGFLMHEKRHFTMDHFICPTCKKGFTKFSHCVAHEIKEHHQGSADSYASQFANGGSGLGLWEVDLEEELCSIVPSTSLYPYRGPPVLGAYEPYEIELKYSKSEKKSYSSIVAKYTLDCQRKRIEEQSDNVQAVRPQQPKVHSSKLKLATKHTAGSGKRSKTKTRYISEDDDQSSSLDDDEEPEYLPNWLKSKKPKSAATVPVRRFRRKKWYFCKVCSYEAGFSEFDIRQHRNLKHPEIPFSRAATFKMKYPNPKSTKTLQESQFQRRRSTKKKQPRAAAGDSNSDEEDQDKVQPKKRKRQKIYRRVWERVKKRVKKDEFISALGLVTKTDVVIGPRHGTAAVVSSLYRKRKGRRDRSPSPHAQVLLKKMTNTTNKSFKLCPLCDFYASSKSDIRRHRGEVHLGSGGTNSRKRRHSGKEPQPGTSKRLMSANREPIPGPSSYTLSPRKHSKVVEPIWCHFCDYYCHSTAELDTHIGLKHRDKGTEKLVKSISQKFIR